MEEYKKSVDSQHAPEALIAQTLQRIHEEERRQSGEHAEKKVAAGDGARHRRRSMIIAAAGMAAALALVIGVSGSRSSLYYNPVPDSLVRGITENGEPSENEMDMETYGAYLGVDLTAVPEDVTLIKANISVSYAADRIQITEDEGTFYYNADGNQVMVKVSATKEVAPEELLSGEASQWHKMTVYAGEDETGGQRLAAVTQGNVHYFVMSYNMSEKEFENFLKKFF